MKSVNNIISIIFFIAFLIWGCFFSHFEKLIKKYIDSALENWTMGKDKLYVISCIWTETQLVVQY